MVAQCPNCLEDFASPWAVTRHLSQPLTSCLRWIDQLESASQILLDPDPYHGFPMDLEPEALPGHWDIDINVNNPDCPYSDEGVTVNLESDVLESGAESLSGQASKPKVFVEHFKGAAKVYQRGQTFQDWFDMDAYAAHRKENIYYPFASLQDWELGSFLLCLSLSMAAINQFLRLELICLDSLIVRALPLSFRTAKDLWGRAELLPAVPKWQCHIVSMTHPTKQPLHLYWRNPLDCIEALFNHLYFANKLDLTPTRVYNTVDHTMWKYSEWMMGDTAWSMQSQLPDGATLLGVILSSDKTNVTNMTDGRVAHPLLISLANIKMATQNKASSHAFLLTALFPIAEFLHPVRWMQSVLEARLVHHCLDIILEPLKQAARIGRMMSDPLGNLRYCFTPLASYIVDMPEACMLACVRGKTSPVTLAMYKEFRDAFRHPPHTAKLTLDQLASITCDPLNVEGYFDECSLFRLSGVFLPFWHNWPLADPSWFLTPEALHHWHHEFYDHDVRWCLRAIGAQELDFCFSVLQQLMTFQHFKDGISNLKQVTGRAQRNMQHYMVALIADAAPPGVIITVHVLMDFRYLSQATTIDELHCRLILDALEQFHNHKQEVIVCGARQGVKSNSVLDNWYIPKLELMQSVVPSIRQDPADSTNHNNYDAQICWFLDQNEKCRNFQITTSIIAQSRLHQQGTISPTIDADTDVGGPSVDEANLQTDANDLWGPRHTVTNFFKMAQQVSLDIKAAKPLRTFLVGTNTAIHLNVDASIQRIPIDIVAEKYSLPNLRGALADYVEREGRTGLPTFHKPEGPHRAQPDAPLPFDDLRVWFKVCIHVTGKYGHYDAAIFTVNDMKLNQWPASGLKGHTVVEVHLVMQPLPPRGKTTPWAARFLTYIQRLDVIPQRRGSLLEHTTQMHVLKRAMRSAGVPFGDILPLDQLRSFAHIVLRFGPVADPRLTAENSAHSAQVFFLNKYIDKEFYYAISN
ncbi:hypothetical protein C8R48DRAFT_777420 [Suillus tomentosus]|nr:hypothetical protein C8R48DRAFT_777420 [Suillus tomentosus]